MLDVMDDMHRQDVAADDVTPAVDRTEEPAAAVARAARLLANPRRVRRA